MKDILRAMFEAYEYDFHFQNEDICVFKHAVYDDFWIVMEYREDLLEIQSPILSFVVDKVLMAYKTAEKNISMVIPMRVDAVTDATKQIIIDLEDNPFYFKKYVIPYTDKDLQEARTMLDPINIADIIMDSATFSSLKCEIEDSSQRVGTYHLLYSFAHKLPFLMMNVTRQSSETLINHFKPNERQQEIYDWVNNVIPEDIEQELISMYQKRIR